ncbi:hypothetical protein HPB51_016640 [Rhipicephalus microplus]|uniref:Uncharacterized protein n=1 Tax=Rhipicephalus microplus TaxID=6941 RepID=A0A9J6EI92_RHIMP|nr:hypothetical protein HPB51_016640 [Rhipicephalus microplus]
MDLHTLMRRVRGTAAPALATPSARAYRAGGCGTCPQGGCSPSYTAYSQTQTGDSRVLQSQGLTSPGITIIITLCADAWGSWGLEFMGLEFFLAQSNVAARLSELRCERKLPTPAMIKPKLGDKECTFSRDSPALKAPVSTSLVASARETADGSYLSRILVFEDVFMDNQDVIAKPRNLANVRCTGDRWRQIQRSSCDLLFDEDAKVTVRRSDHVLNASSLHGMRHQKVLPPRGVGRSHICWYDFSTLLEFSNTPPRRGGLVTKALGC